MQSNKEAAHGRSVLQRWWPCARLELVLWVSAHLAVKSALEVFVLCEHTLGPVNNC
jgi:hypothetical protein